MLMIVMVHKLQGYAVSLEDVEGQTGRMCRDVCDFVLRGLAATLGLLHVGCCTALPLECMQIVYDDETRAKKHS